MTTGATGQLGLALPVQGELSGTWGDTVNNGITQYTNIAIAGTLTLTGDGAVTLANTTGDASASNITSTLAGAGTVTAQFAIVRVTGTLTVAKVVTGPSYSKTYTVVNAATGGIVTFKASGQTGVSVAVGESAFVYFNGTDYVKLVGTATAGAAGGSNTQVQFNSSGILSGSSSLTWDGTTLSSTQVNITGQGTLRLQDTTGGEYVGLRAPASLGASYTLTWPADDGTSGQALITDGSGGLSWSTAASGDVYGPASATDNALARFDGTTGKIIKDSSGLIYDGANLGVGTASPTYKLNVVASAGSQNIFQAGQSGVSNGYTISSDGTNLTYQWYPTGSEGMRLTSTGLGIGTSSPTVKLETSTARSATVVSAIFTETGTGAVNDVNKITIKVMNTASGQTGGVGVGAVLEAVSSNKTGLALYYDAGSGVHVEGVRLDSAGNLGLGVTPSAWSLLKAFQIGNTSLAGYSGTGYLMTNAYFDGSVYRYTSSNYANLYTQNNSVGQHAWNIAASGTAGDAISFTQAMTLDASGNLGVGTTSPSTYGKFVAYSSGGYFAVDANGQVNSVQLLDTASAGGRFSGFSSVGLLGTINIEQTTTGSAGGYIAFRTSPSGSTSPTERARIDSSGQFILGPFGGNGNAVFAGSSSPGYTNQPGTNLLIKSGDGSGSGFSYMAFFTSPQGSSGTTVNTAVERMRITEAGSVGIGTASPISLLNATFSGGTVSGTHSMAFGYPYAANLQLKSTNAGTSVAVASVGLYGNPERTREFAFYNQATDARVGYLGYQYGSGGVITDLGLFNALAGALTFSTNNTEQARFDSSGNLLVGTTSTNGSTSNTARVVGGIFSSFKGEISSAATNTSYTMFDTGANYACYIVSVIGIAADAANYSTTAVVNMQNTSVSISYIDTGGLIFITNSGTAIQVNQNSGGTMGTIAWSVMRIA